MAALKAKPETQEEKDARQYLLAAIEARMPWPIIQSIFRKLDISTGQGVKATFQKLRSQANTDPALIAKFPHLRKYYTEHYLFGEKTIRLYSIKGAELFGKISGIQIKGDFDSPFREAYPFLLEQTALEELPHESFLVDAFKRSQGIGFVFCSKRYVTERIEYEKEQLEKYEDFREYDELIAVRHTPRQLFDIVFVHESKGKTVIEVRQDAPFDMPSDEIDVGFKMIWRAFSRFIYKKTKIDLSELNPTNLFPAVSSLYNSSEGRVCELGFTTDTGTVQRVKMRKRDVDLRSEEFHKAGKKAVKLVSPFRVAIDWKRKSEDIDSNPELMLPGSVRMLHDPNKRKLQYAITHRCVGEQDYNFVFSKILSHLK